MQQINDFQKGYELGVRDCIRDSFGYESREYDNGFEKGYEEAMKIARNDKFKAQVQALKRVKDLMVDEKVDWQLQMKIESILLDYIERP